uniref:DoxX family protein n=1 Tax=Parerythrobacter lutipelagi TaxID=1964208 RepID=UPI0010F8A48E|nr:DoxX family protein [Parerythrobacter lutipelagi]
MQRVLAIYDRTTNLLSGKIFESGALLLTRLALAGVFWSSGRTKVVEGTWFTIDETQYYLFEEFGLPISPQIMVPMSMYAEFFLPLLVAFGLFTRIGAAALLGMTLVIQFFVFPEAWWPVHSLWAAMALVLIARGGGLISLDALALKMRQ